MQLAQSFNGQGSRISILREKRKSSELAEAGGSASLPNVPAPLTRRSTFSDLPSGIRLIFAGDVFYRRSLFLSWLNMYHSRIALKKGKVF
jgi:hypothetical protein